MATLRGKIVKGLGRGHQFLAISGYKSRIGDILSEDPYPGTLNVKCGKGDKEEFIRDLKPKFIGGFEEDGRVFGAVEYYDVSISGDPAILVIPVLTTHGPEIAEIVATENLKQKLEVSEGDEIIIDSN